MPNAVLKLKGLSLFSFNTLSKSVAFLYTFLSISSTLIVEGLTETLLPDVEGMNELCYLM